MIFFEKPIIYLETTDFNKMGELINPYFKDKKVIVLLQANYCQFCTDIKPFFQKAANKYHPTVIFATIQADGERTGEREFSRILDYIKPGFLGFPDFVKYVNGKRINDNGPSDRDYKSIVEYALK